MKVGISKDKGSRLINCGEVILVAAAYENKATITTCAWHMPVSKDPPLISVALAKKHFSSELIKGSGAFTINVPDWSLLNKVISCGSVSGRNIDKFKEIRLTPQKSLRLTGAVRIEECIGCIECSLVDIKEAGDHYIFLGEVVSVEADNNYFINDCWDTSKIDLIFHAGGRKFFKSSPHIEFKK
jgi:flavin reductase (DIM6/NTAB) family NADH-FMN oxidoreductase RutF